MLSECSKKLPQLMKAEKITESTKDRKRKKITEDEFEKGVRQVAKNFVDQDIYHVGVLSEIEQKHLEEYIDGKSIPKVTDDDFDQIAMLLNDDINTENFTEQNRTLIKAKKLSHPHEDFYGKIEISKLKEGVIPTDILYNPNLIKSKTFYIKLSHYINAIKETGAAPKDWGQHVRTQKQNFPDEISTRAIDNETNLAKYMSSVKSNVLSKKLGACRKDIIDQCFKSNFNGSKTFSWEKQTKALRAT